MIFLDLSLPKISGLEVLKAIKSTPHLMHIPIVVASGTEDPEHIRAVYALNGNCFMRKPSDLTQFLRFIEMCYEFWGSVVTLSPPPRSFPDMRPLDTSDQNDCGASLGSSPQQCVYAGHQIGQLKRFADEIPRAFLHGTYFMSGLSACHEDE